MLGSKRIDQIKKADIADVIEATLKAGKSYSAAGLVRSCVSGPLEIAVFREMIPANPANGIFKQMGISRSTEKKNKNTGKDKIDYLTMDQARLFLQTCGKQWPEYKVFFMFMFLTGCRLGEAVALEWGDINWNDHFVQFNKAFRLELTPTKNGKARNVDLSEQLVEELRQHRRMQRGGNVVFITSRDLVFPYKGGYLRQNQARRIFKRVLKRVELPDIRLHCIRHSYASIMLANGATLDYVKRMLGHSSISMTSDLYGHLMPNRDRSSVNLLSNQILHPMRTLEKEKVVTYGSYDLNNSLVAMQGIEPRTLRI